MEVCWKCKNECESVNLFKSKLTNFKAYICNKCCDGYTDICESCGKSDYIDLMYCAEHIDITKSNPEEYLYYCSYNCADNNGEYVHECDNCKIIFEAPTVLMYQSNKNDSLKFYCSDYCVNEKDLVMCDKCEMLHKKTDCYSKLVNYSTDTFLIYTGFDCSVCKTCKFSFKFSSNKSDLCLYKEGFCCSSCKNNFDNTFTEHTISNLFSKMDIEFIKLIKERGSVRKLEINSYSNFELVCSKMRSLGWRVIRGDSTFFVKEIDGCIFMVGRSFVFSPNNVLGRRGWLYNYVKEIDQSVLKVLSERYIDFKYILSFYDGRVNNFK